MSNSDQHQFKDRYMLRLPDGMRDRIKRAAEANNRSMNAEIVATLEGAYPSKHFDLAEAFNLWVEISAGIEDMTDAQKMNLIEQFKRTVTSSGLSVALSGGVLRIIATTTPPYMAEMSIPVFEGSSRIMRIQRGNTEDPTSDD